MITPRCRLGIRDHEWVEGDLSKFCANCYLVKPYDQLRKQRPKPPPPARTVRIVRSDPSPQRRALVIERDGLVCRYCKRPVVETQDETRPDRLTIDHVHPRSLGGTNELANLAVACHVCNCAKGDKLPQDFTTHEWGQPSKRDLARAHNEAANRHQETHTRTDGTPKRPYEREEAFAAAQRLNTERARGAMDAFECPDCGWWHVRIVPGLAAILASKRHRFYDDALIIELGLRAVGVMKGENMDARPRRGGTRSRAWMIKNHWKGAERRAKHRRAELEAVA